MIEENFDIPFVAEIALREKQIQQNYRPIIAVHKWFARRSGTLFRALILSEYQSGNIKDTFYKNNNLNGCKIIDPFMGGGTPLLEANRVGCDIEGYDINPMAYWIVKQELENINLEEYSRKIQYLRSELEKDIGNFYRTKCQLCNSERAHVKYFLWVKQHNCSNCGNNFDLFPGYILAKKGRHPTNVIVCRKCGELNEKSDITALGQCTSCGSDLVIEGNAKRNRGVCPHCGFENEYPGLKKYPPKHRMFAIEYHCDNCKKKHKGRFFKKPDQEDLLKYQICEEELVACDHSFIPDDEIPSGDESDRLHKWNYKYYRELFNSRQLLGLVKSCNFISKQENPIIKNALATNLSDLLRYQNMLCRYDTKSLKSLDIFSVHGFPVGLIHCESNLLGIQSSTKIAIGSGGWLNIGNKYIKAKTYCQRPFEILKNESSRKVVYLDEEWIGSTNDSFSENRRAIELNLMNTGLSDLKPESVDGVFTDPPYFGNVQYAELMDFCYIWLRRIVNDNNIFGKTSTRNVDELTSNSNMGRGIGHFTNGLSQIFCKMSYALKLGCPLVFTYHHNSFNAYIPIIIAILDSKMVCTATLPCPGEMAASIHIKGTKSSIVDTIFICRKNDGENKEFKINGEEELDILLKNDLTKLIQGNVKPTEGDKRCIIFGHLSRFLINKFGNNWDSNESVQKKIITIQNASQDICDENRIQKIFNIQ